MESRTRIALRWRDLDLLGHLNQATYHEFMEEGRATLLERLRDFRFVLAHVEMNFRHEVRHGHGSVDVVMRVSAAGRTSVTIDHQIRLPDGALAADGRTVLVAWDVDQRRARPLTDVERAVLTGG
jgi:acyl-CoA thioester hydrolase